MSHAERCPVCFGKGTFFIPNDYSTGGGETKTCHGCYGKGWVAVEDERKSGFHDVDKFYLPNEEEKK